MTRPLEFRGPLFFIVVTSLEDLQTPNPHELFNVYEKTCDSVPKPLRVHEISGESETRGHVHSPVR